MSLEDKAALISSRILEANRENTLAISEEMLTKKEISKFKKSRAKSFLDRALLTSNSLDPSRLESLTGIPSLRDAETSSGGNEIRKKRKKRNIIYDNDNNSMSINKRNYFFNKKLERNY